MEGNDVGGQVLRYRTARRMTQRALAEAAGVTSGFVSQLETGRANATIATLRRIADALGVGLVDLVEPGAVPAARIVRADARRTLSAANGMTKWFLTEPPFGHVEMYAVAIEPGGSTGPERYHHGDAEEVLLVLAGEVLVELDEERYELGAGDTIVYPSSVPHRVSNPADRTAELVWLNSPPTPGG
ncbi:helix-turn-helix domain-containing protein [Agromyces sp. NPDC058064]|uniref:helix-turn-helix domain-containing protein n=1 Tax=Agromyces sp. NPDC058064 TaxID=3346322 RepID=UPI0036DE7FDC